MYAKQCQEYKKMEIWKEELCRWCISSCEDRCHDYDLAGTRWSLKCGGHKRTKRSVDVELVEPKGKESEEVMLMSWKNANKNRVVEAGTYLVEVTNWKDHKSAAGNPCIILETVVVGSGSEEASPDNEIGAKIADFLTLTESAAWKLAWVVNTLGISIAELPDMDTGGEEFLRILNACKGRRMFVTCTKGVNNGKDVNNITNYMPDESQETVEVKEEVPSFIKNRKTTKE
jgi:hypothetical protein